VNLIYGVKDKPTFGKTLVFAFQQVLAILAATIAVPSIIGNGMSQSAALFGAGIGTLVYLLFTKFKSPVFFRGACQAKAVLGSAAGGKTPDPRQHLICPVCRRLIDRRGSGKRFDPQ